VGSGTSAGLESACGQSLTGILRTRAGLKSIHQLWLKRVAFQTSPAFKNEEAARVSTAGRQMRSR
jgi:hypothetical protein